MISVALRKVLLDDAAVAALVATRIYPGVFPQDPTWPAIRYFRVSGQRGASHSGPTPLDKARYQLDCVAATYLGAQALGRAVRDALRGYQGTVEGVVIDGIFFDNDSDHYDDETGAWRYRADFQVWSREA